MLASRANILGRCATRCISRKALSFRASRDLHVGFIGLGNMGSHMSVNLCKAGHKVKAFDREEAAKATIAAGGASAATVAEAIEGVDAVITMLPSSPHVARVLRDEVFEIASNAATSPVLVDCSTIDPNTTKQLAGEAAALGLGLLDAPVSGGVGGAEAGTLTFMVGGTSEALGKAKPLLNAMGAKTVHCGDAGTGQVAKIVNNLILGISMLGVSEAMNLGVKLGADPKVLADIVNTSTGRCWSSDTYNPVPGVMDGVPSSREYVGGFGSALMRKDLGLAAQAAQAVNAPLPAGSTALAMYELISQHGYATKDFGAMYDFLAKKEG